jgi:hypothetical protein
MNLPNWFRIAWWFVLAGVLTAFLFVRLHDLIEGRATLFDSLAFALWVCVILAPIFVEVELLGVKLKQQIDSVKTHVDRKMESLRAEIRNSVDVRSDFSPRIYLSPPPDDQLPKLEEQVKGVVQTELKRIGLDGARGIAPVGSLTIPPDNTYFFQTRFAIERELQRLWKTYGQDGGRTSRALLVGRVLPTLTDRQIITPQLAHVIREVYSVCSPAIHGEDVSEAQKNFVRDVTPDLIKTLQAIM